MRGAVSIALAFNQVISLIYNEIYFPEVVEGMHFPMIVVSFGHYLYIVLCTTAVHIFWGDMESGSRNNDH